MSEIDKNHNEKIIEIHHIELKDYKDKHDPEDKCGIYTYNEALGLIGTGKFHILLLFICGGCLMSVILETLNMGFIISAAECDLNLSFEDKGILNGSAFLGAVLSAYFWGFLSDTWGRRKVMMLACGASFISSIISSFSFHVWMLIIMRFLVGVFISGNSAIPYAYLAEFHSEKTRAKAISMGATFMAFGMTALPALAWLIIPLDTTLNLYVPFTDMRYSMWRLYIVICSSLSCLLFLGLLYLPESGKFDLTHGKDEKTLQTLKKMYRWNKNDVDASFPVKTVKLDAMDSSFADEVKKKSKMGIKYVWSQTVPLFKYPLATNTLKASFLMFGLFAGSSGLFMWIPDILNNYINYKDDGMTVCEVVKTIRNEPQLGNNGTTGTTPLNKCPAEVNATIFMITLGMGIIFSICYAVNGLVINYFGKKVLLNSWFVFCGICGVCTIWSTDFYLTLVLLVGFLAAGVCGSVLSAISVDLFPTNYRAMALCLILMTGRLGAMTGSNLIAFLLTYNCDMIFILFGGLLIVCAAIGATLPGK